MGGLYVLQFYKDPVTVCFQVEWWNSDKSNKLDWYLKNCTVRKKLMTEKLNGRDEVIGYDKVMDGTTLPFTVDME